MMTEYNNVINNVASRLRETPEPVQSQQKSQPQDNATETLLNTIGLAINREGGMNN